MFATDNGRDLPSHGVSDELNLIVDGGDYGWPDCWDSHEGSNCDGTFEPIALFEEHASANGLAFYTGSMFPQWRNQPQGFLCFDSEIQLNANPTQTTHNLTS